MTYSAKTSLCLIFCTLMLTLPAQVTKAQDSSPSDTLYFVLRVDDILSRNTTWSPSSIIPFQEMAESRGAIVSWAVMPHRLLEPNVNRNGVLGRELLQTIARGHEVTLHGYTHICQRCNQSSHEMFCTTHNQSFTSTQQRRIITDGLRILADSIGIRPTVFIPPGHVHDITTLQVLDSEGFEVIAVVRQEGLTEGNLYNIGTSTDWGWALTEANYAQRRDEALDDIARSADRGLYTLLLHDPFTREAYLDGLLLRWTAEVLDSVTVRYGNRLRFVSMEEAGRARRLLVTGTPEQDNLPVTATLEPNYPNPFNPSTTLRYEIKEAGFVVLEVFDVHGRRSAVLANHWHTPGTFTATFDAGDLSSGVYVARLQTGNSTLSRKMVLIR